MSTAPLRVIVNPAASSGRGGTAAEALLRELDGHGIRCETRYTEAPGHAARLAARAALDRVDRLAVVGGDGTIHEVAGGLLASGAARVPAVAICPVGTGNDFYRMVSPRRGVKELPRLLQEGTVKRFDVGRVRWEGGERVFVNLLGVGVDVEVLRCRARYSRLPGLPQYLMSFLHALARFRPPDVNIEVAGPGPAAGAEPAAGSEQAAGCGGQHIRGRTTLSVITVGPSIGGGFMINPEAQASDGQLDLCHVAAGGLVPILRLVPKVMRGAHAGAPLVTMRRLERAVIRDPHGKPMWFELDGELAPEPAPELRVEVIPGAFPVLVSDDR
ncbi:MAG: diacylglycerol kinase family lipid kinase [Gemmatimonadota bacterium]|nr:diacylglycerol kinase family lipid kinase [Gemmatimonadota bacterium]